LDTIGSVEQTIKLSPRESLIYKYGYQAGLAAGVRLAIDHLKLGLMQELAATVVEPTKDA
jgi:hypothetical protein